MISKAEQRKRIKSAIRRGIDENNLLDMDKRELMDNLSAVQKHKMLHKKLGAKYGC